MKRLRSIVLAAVAFGGTALAADPPAAPDSKADPDAEVAALVDSFKHLPLLRSLKIDAKRFSAFLAQSHYARPARDFSTALASVASPLDEACRPVYVEPGGFLKISSAELSGVALRGDPGEIAAALDVAQVQMCLRARKAGLGDEALGGVDAYRSVLARQMVLQEYKRYSAKD